MASVDESIAVSPTVVSVQELIKRPLNSVPERYIRLDQTTQALPLDPDRLLTVPTIDMKKVLESSDKSSSDELQRLHYSCREWGIFQVSVNSTAKRSLP